MLEAVLIELDKYFPEGLCIADLYNLLKDKFDIDPRNTTNKQKIKFDNTIAVMINESLLFVQKWDMEEVDGFLQNPANRVLKDTIRCTLNIKGYELLNQIRIKHSIKGLDTSIKNFNTSSNRWSKWLTYFTFALVVLTIVLVVTNLLH